MRSYSTVTTATITRPTKLYGFGNYLLLICFLFEKFSDASAMQPVVKNLKRAVRFFNVLPIRRPWRQLIFLTFCTKIDLFRWPILESISITFLFLTQLNRNLKQMKPKITLCNFVKYKFVKCKSYIYPSLGGARDGKNNFSNVSTSV